MPQQVKHIKQFIEYARREDASAARIKTSIVKPNKLAAGSTKQQAKKSKKGENKVYKFKLRTSKNLYTLALRNGEMAAKIKQALPPNLNVTEIGPKN